MRRRFLPLAAMLAVLLSIVPAAATSVAAQGADYDISGGHFYTQANGDGSANGFAVTDDASAPMWTWFQKYGGVGQLGYPNTNRFQSADGFIEQGFQKSLLQWHPDTQTMAFVNIFDLLHGQQGMDNVLQQTYQIPPPIDNSAQEKGINGADPNGFKQLEAIRDAWLQYPNPGFVNYYNADPYHVDHFGLPTSKPADFGPFITVRLQRTAFQIWKVDGPAGIKAGTLVQVNGSDIAKAVNFYPKAATTPSAPPAGAPAAAPSGPVSAAGLQYGFAAEIIGASATQAVNATKGAGFGWIKQQIRWDGLQPSPSSTPNWGPADAAVNAANAAGLKVMFSVVAAPSWAAVPGGHFPAHPSDAAAFFGAMAAHFKGRVQAYEVWNEENYAVEMGPGVGPNTAGAYVEALKAVYPAIKAADPNAIVVTGAPTPTGVNDPNIGERDITFLQQMYAYQNGVVKQYFDALGAHNEPFGNQPQETVANHTAAGWSNDPSFFFRQVEDYHNLMVQNGDSKPIWETEVGYDSNPLAPDAYGYAKLITEQNQADWLVALFNYTKQNYPWMGTMFVWNLNYQAVVPQADEKWGFGVLRGDYSPRPAYTALANMPKS